RSLGAVSSVRVRGTEMVGRALLLGSSDLDGVQVTITGRHTRLSGTVRDDKGVDRNECRIILFPVDPARWVDYFALLPGFRPIQQILVDRTAHFQTEIVPGDYFVASVGEVPDLWMAPEFLKTLVPRATRVRIGPGEFQDIIIRM